MPAFWLDSDVLIQAANDAYQFDLAPGFWEFLEENIANHTFCMPREVLRELEERDDELHAWVRKHATFPSTNLVGPQRCIRPRGAAHALPRLH